MSSALRVHHKLPCSLGRAAVCDGQRRSISSRFCRQVHLEKCSPVLLRVGLACIYEGGHGNAKSSVAPQSRWPCALSGIFRFYFFRGPIFFLRSVVILYISFFVYLVSCFLTLSLCAIAMGEQNHLAFTFI